MSKTNGGGVIIPQISFLLPLLKKCCYSRSINPGKQAHCLMITTASSPLLLSNALLHLYLTCSDLPSALNLFDKMPIRDTVSGNTLLSGLARSGHLPAAESLFLSMPRRDLISYNSLSSSLLLAGDAPGAASLLPSALSSGLSPDACTLSLSLKACSSLLWPRLGSQLHSLALRLGLGSHPVAASALVGMYGKCRLLDDSLRVFARLPEKNAVVWSAALAGRVGAGDFAGAVEMLRRRMEETADCGGATQAIYATLFWGCGSDPSHLAVGRQLHGHGLKTGLGVSDVVVMTATLDMYMKCEAAQDAREVFDEMPTRNRRTYNAMIVGHGARGEGAEGLGLFRELTRTALGCDEVSISGSLKSCCPGESDGGGGGLLEGRQIHGLAVRKGMWGKVVVENAAVDMYGKCGEAEDARRVFDEMESRDVVSWNAVMSALERNDGGGEALSLFAEMLGCGVRPDEFTFGSVLKACSAAGTIGVGMEVHGRAVKSGLDSRVFVSVGLVDMYCKCGALEESLKVHWGMEGEAETASWNTIISGFSSQQRSEEAQAFFALMLERRVRPDGFTYAAMLDESADLATAGLGAQIHCCILKLRLHYDVYISSTLLDMYSKCGNLADACQVFDRAPARDFVTWNAMISCLAHHGRAEEAVAAYRRMVGPHGLPPNHSTFLSLLRACGHMGLVEAARVHLGSMHTAYGLRPRAEHYSCMVDVVGRAGRVGDAVRIVEGMGRAADMVTWRTLLSICNLHGDVRVGERAVRAMTEAGLEEGEEEVAAHVLLCNMYAGVGRWEEADRRRERLRFRGMKKEPGCSWIEIGNRVHVFVAGDFGHCRSFEICSLLRLVGEEMRRDHLCVTD